MPSALALDLVLRENLPRSRHPPVADILDAASEIGEVTALGREAWDKDRIRQLAVERLLEIIGEAANSLSEEFRAQHPAIPWRDIIGLRVVLAHHYHRVDPGQVWAIAARLRSKFRVTRTGRARAISACA